MEWLLCINDKKLFFFVGEWDGGWGWWRGNHAESLLEGLRRRAFLTQQWQIVSKISGSNLLAHKRKLTGWRIGRTDEEPF